MANSSSPHTFACTGSGIVQPLLLSSPPAHRGKWAPCRCSLLIDPEEERRKSPTAPRDLQLNLRNSHSLCLWKRCYRYHPSVSQPSKCTMRSSTRRRRGWSRRKEGRGGRLAEVDATSGPVLRGTRGGCDQNGDVTAALRGGCWASCGG